MFEKIDVQINAKDLHNTIGRVLGSLFLIIRSKRQISPEQVCHETKINLKSLEKIEKGKSSLYNLDIETLIDYYNLDVSLNIKEK